MLVKVVIPICEVLYSEEMISSWFFLRYWNGGPHVRLRLANPKEVQFVETILRVECGSYFSTHKAPTIDLNSYGEQIRRMGRLSDASKLGPYKFPLEIIEELQSAPCMRVREYMFETSRFGADAGRAATEEHFFRSSKIAALCLRAVPVGLTVRNGLALRMAAVTLIVLKANDRTYREQFYPISLMLEFLYLKSSLEVFNDAGLSLQSEDLKRVSDLLGELSNPTLSSLRKTWDSEVVEEWRSEMETSFSRLTDFRYAGKLCRPVSGIIIDYLHLLMNRMGIPMVMEYYIYTILKMADSGADG